MIHAALIVKLKSDLRREYTKLMTMDTYGTGNEMFNHITGGRLDAQRTKCNLILAQLREIDPNAPKKDIV